MTKAPMPRWVVIVLLLVSLGVFGWRMNTAPLTNWDEGIYANVNLELFQSRDWTKLTYFGADFLEKPPLQFWATYPLIGIFGPTEFAIRFWSVAAGIGTVILLGVWGWQATQKKYVALLVGLLFMFGRFASIHAFRTGDVDGLVTFFVTLAMYGYWRSLNVPKWIVLWGAASAAAVMTKSFVGLLPLIIVGLDMLLTRGWRRIGWSTIAWAVGTFVVLVAPWHIIETMRFGQTFWDSYFGMHVLERTTESLFTKTPWYWYLGIIRDRFFPFSYALPLVVVMTAWRWRRTHDDLTRILLLWGAVVLGVFTLIQTRREWYILPFYPAAAMLIVLQLETWWLERQARTLQVLIGVSSVALFARMAGDKHLKEFLVHLPGSSVLQTSAFTHLLGQWAIGIGATLIIFVIAYVGKRKYFWWQTSLAVTGGVMFLAAMFWSIQNIRSYPMTLPLKTIAEKIQQEQLLKIDLVGTKLKKEPAGYFYILRLATHSSELPANTVPKTPVFLTTNEAKNVPVNTEGKALVTAGKFLLLDLR